MSIYIARGDDTLGPYTPTEAAELIRHGDLQPDDYAARDGDAEWVALASFLSTPMVDVHAPPPQPRPRRVRAVLLALLLAGLAGFGVTRRQRPSVPLTPPAPPAPPALRSEMPTPLVIVPNAAEPPPTPPAVRLTGSVLPADSTAVRVSAYPLAALEPFLARKRAERQAELDRLAPLIATADAEKAVRLDDEHRTLQAVVTAAPDDDMGASLVFAHEQAKAAVDTAEKNCRYLDDQRREALDAAAYFQDLPPPVATAETDPQGGFTLELPAGGPFAVAASASVSTPDGPRARYWLVKVPTDEAARGPLLLSDANAAAAGTDASLIR